MTTVRFEEDREAELYTSTLNSFPSITSLPPSLPPSLLIPCSDIKYDILPWTKKEMSHTLSFIFISVVNVSTHCLVINR